MHVISKGIERAREYEAIKSSMASLTGIKSHNNNINYINESFSGNFGLHHERRACPARIHVDSPICK